ncbi:hypothetical protein [Streptomyces sp. URMC 129]|uniref:hypothetical protein n=1 Tax=Streptomyces sp. URMC 129 TaxID=3423407 RepID=UPI003F1E3B33
MTVPGFGSPIPPPPTAPPTVGLPRDPWIAVTAAVLNLSGLGAGYLFLRRWRRAIPCWIATGGLLFLALPVDAGGVAGLWVVLYAALLVLAALDAWRLAGPRLVRGPWAPLTAGVLLLALPAGSVVFFDRAQRQALEEDLTERLVAADALVEDATWSEERYRSALTAYLAVRAEHPSTDAAAEVPARLDALYRQSVEDHFDDACATLDPLRFYRGLTGDFEDEEAERLAEDADDLLPEALLHCGLEHLDDSGIPQAEAPFSELLADYPDSGFAQSLPDRLDERQREIITGIGDGAPCPAVDRLRELNELLAGLPGDEFARMAADGAEPVPEGLYQCGTSMFLSSQFALAETSLRDLVDNHPDHERADRARDILIAAEIAKELPAAGEELPPEPGSEGGATITLEIFNDSPYELELLFTGPRTGTERVAACDGCSLYPTDPGDSACADSGVDYPSTTLELPAGDYYFLHRSPGRETESLAEADSFDPDYIYTYCSYVTEDDLLLPDGGTEI